VALECGLKLDVALEKNIQEGLKVELERTK